MSAFFAFQAKNIQMSYEFKSLLPQSDSARIIYESFKEKFGSDGGVMFIAMQDSNFFKLDKFNAAYDLIQELQQMKGIEKMISIVQMYELSRNDSIKKFEFKQILEAKPKTQSELNLFKAKLHRLPFYEGLLFNSQKNVYVLGITLNQEVLNSKKRTRLVKDIQEKIDDYCVRYQIVPHYSGLPYIRTMSAQKVEKEMKYFVVLSMLIASLLLFLFFRNIRAVIFPMLIVVINLIIVFGTMVLFGYKVTMLTGIIPPLLIVIIVENSIFILNKYYTEYQHHKKKILGLHRVIQRIGYANLLTNTTTAAGFIAFIITRNDLLVEFGLIASLNIIIAYILTLVLIPIFFSFLPDPKARHYKHLSGGNVTSILSKISYIIVHKPRWVYSFAGISLLVSIAGIAQLKTTGRIVDDLPRGDALYQDLLFFEENFNGIMPLEISIDLGKKKAIQNLRNIKKIDQLQAALTRYPQLSKSLSVANVIKFSKQAFYRGKPAMYSLPNNQEKAFIFSYYPKINSSQKGMLTAFVDSSQRYTRISVQMANLGTYQIDSLKQDIRLTIDSIFSPKKYNVDLTGTSVVFLKGTKYLVNNLFSSLLLAVVIIAILMFLLFNSFRMVFISLIPNVIPLFITAAMMGFFDISIKPSTVLIFSIALGISVDNSIHFLSRYRLHLNKDGWNIKEAALATLNETGFSMIYSSIILFFGFIVFVLSSFGGTQALGYLIAFTLIVALLSNLFILPSLILSLDKWLTTKAFKEPFLEVYDEEDDIELNQIEIDE
jgi:predicted RND superfamily exporter protein